MSSSFSTDLTQNIRLRNQYPLTQKYQTPPKIFDPKISDGHPRMFDIQVLPLGF